MDNCGYLAFFGCLGVGKTQLSTKSGLYPSFPHLFPQAVGVAKHGLTSSFALSPQGRALVITNTFIKDISIEDKENL